MWSGPLAAITLSVPPDFGVVLVSVSGGAA
jgi:hypothetical protein